MPSFFQFNDCIQNLLELLHPWNLYLAVAQNTGRICKGKQAFWKINFILNSDVDFDVDYADRNLSYQLKSLTPFDSSENK